MPAAGGGHFAEMLEADFALMHKTRLRQFVEVTGDRSRARQKAILGDDVIAGGTLLANVKALKGMASRTSGSLRPMALLRKRARSSLSRRHHRHVVTDTVPIDPLKPENMTVLPVARCWPRRS
jgi:phosphoribosylpyrophosphate synthetase